MTHSHSAIKQYEQCPASYKFSRIDRLPNPSGEAAERGKLIHAEIEAILLGGLPILTDEVSHLRPKLEELRNKRVQPELKLGVTRDWQPCEFDAPDVWLRGVLDVYHEEGDKALIIDWKSGKRRDYYDQLRLYAAMVFANEPAIQHIVPRIEFIDLKKTDDYPPISRSEYEDIVEWVNHRISVLEKDVIFATNPSSSCRWCSFRKDNGGPCKW